MLKTARRDLDAGDYASANNRAYYCVFHAMRATLALTGEDYKKHSAVIARFSEKYLKTNKLPREFGKLVSNASRIRNRSDYQDFYICSIDDTRALVAGAEEFLASVTDYLTLAFKEAEDTE